MSFGITVYSKAGNWMVQILRLKMMALTVSDQTHSNAEEEYMFS